MFSTIAFVCSLAAVLFWVLARIGQLGHSAITQALQLDFEKSPLGVDDRLGEEQVLAKLPYIIRTLRENQDSFDKRY